MYTEAMQLKDVARSGFHIRYIKNPSEAVRLKAVRQTGDAIKNIENPSESLQLEAVDQTGYAIQYIKNASEAVKLRAVARNGSAIKYIENPSEAVKLEAVKHDGWAIEYIENPSESLQLEALKHEYIKNPSEAVKNITIATLITAQVIYDQGMRAFGYDNRVDRADLFRTWARARNHIKMDDSEKNKTTYIFNDGSKVTITAWELSITITFKDGSQLQDRGYPHPNVFLVENGIKVL